jgi:hypothetical protein
MFCPVIGGCDDCLGSDSAGNPASQRCQSCGFDCADEQGGSEPPEVIALNTNVTNALLALYLLVSEASNVECNEFLDTNLAYYSDISSSYNTPIPSFNIVVLLER